jgi:hypothetical protein
MPGICHYRRGRDRLCLGNVDLLPLDHRKIEIDIAIPSRERPIFRRHIAASSDFSTASLMALALIRPPYPSCLTCSGTGATP